MSEPVQLQGLSFSFQFTAMDLLALWSGESRVLSATLQNEPQGTEAAFRMRWDAETGLVTAVVTELDRVKWETFLGQEVAPGSTITLGTNKLPHPQMVIRDKQKTARLEGLLVGAVLMTVTVLLLGMLWSAL